MDNKTIDVLMATYNGEKYVAEQIESILNQTYSAIRLLISDDASTDGTRQILQDYAEKDKRIQLFFQENNLGYIGNFEFLLTKVENEIFMLCDQDDVWKEDKIQKTYEKCQIEHADLVFTDLEVVDEHLKTIYPSFNDYMLLTRKIKKYSSDYRMQYLYNCVTGCTLLSKKKYIPDMLPLPKESKYVVHDLWIALTVMLKGGKVAYLDEKTIYYRQHGNNQIGTEKTSHKFKKLDEVRNLFLQVKIELFTAYVNYPKNFPEFLQKRNQEALAYFEHLKEVKYFNLKGWGIFHRLYKTETVKYYLLQFCIMNLPAIARVLFAIRYRVLKALRKR